MIAYLLAGCGPSFPPDQPDLSIQTIVWVDETRETPEVGDFAGAPVRDLPTRLWIGPSAGSDAGTRPLLLIAHGMGGHPDKFDAFASHLANAGIVVAAPAFPVSNRDAEAGLLSAGDLAEQAVDLGFVLDRLLEAEQDPDSALWGRFDPDRIGALGHSMGGATLLGYARFDGGDQRIGAEAYLAPAAPLTVLFGPVVAPAGPPTLLMHGLDDVSVLPSISEDLYDALDDPRWYLGIEGAGHSDPIEDDTEPASATRDAAQRAVRAWMATALDDAPDALPDALGALQSEGHLVLP